MSGDPQLLLSFGPLKEGDWAHLTALLSYAFALGHDQVANWLEGTEPAEVMACYRGAELAGVALVRTRAMVGRRADVVATIGGVATAPHLRGMGVARGLMRAILEDLSARRAAWAVLYPFDPAFYEALGWGAGTPMVDLSLRDLSPLGHPSHGGTYRMVSTEDWPSLDGIHRRWAASQEGVLSRHPADWTRLLHRPHATRYCALWEGHGEAAYVVYEMRRAPTDPRTQTVLSVQDWAWTGPEGRQALELFLARHASQVGCVRLKVALVDPLATLDGPGVQRHLVWGPMVRMVDPTAVRLGTEAPGVGLTVEVNDPLAVWTDRRFTWRGDGFAPTQDQAPQLRTDVATFSSLLWGSLSAEAAARAGRLEGERASVEAFNRLLPRDPPFFLDWF